MCEIIRQKESVGDCGKRKIQDAPNCQASIAAATDNDSIEANAGVRSHVVILMLINGAATGTSEQQPKRNQFDRHRAMALTVGISQPAQIGSGHGCDTKLLISLCPMACEIIFV